MKYLLEPEEYERLVATEARAWKEANVIIQELCTRVADSQPVMRRWAPDNPASPWGCILTTQRGHDMAYCDECPVSKWCPYPHKEWSK